MSSGGKYVPSFLRNQGANGGAGSAGEAGTNVNRFAAFDDDFKAPKTNTVVAPSVAPATLASLTTDSKSQGRSYASRFSEKSRYEDKRSGPAVKKTDISSEEQFPTLGGVAKKPVGAWGKSAAGEAKLSTLAQQWSKQKEEEEAAAEVIRLAEENKRLEEEMMALALKNSIKRSNSGGFENPDYSEEDYFHNPYAAQELLADEDSVELPSEDEPSDGDDDDYDENGEYNPNIGYDGRRKDDLY